MYVSTPPPRAFCTVKQLKGLQAIFFLAIVRWEDTVDGVEWNKF